MRERAESSMRQMDEVKELQKNIIMDRDIIFQEKEILKDRVIKQADELINLKD